MVTAGANQKNVSPTGCNQNWDLDGCCKLSGDKDFVSPEWCQSRRDQDNIQQASAIQYQGRCYGSTVLLNL